MSRAIVVGLDGGDESRDALALAGLLSEPGDRIIATLVYRFNPLVEGTGFARWEDDIRREAEAWLAEADMTTLPSGVVTERCVLRADSAARGLQELAEQVQAEAIVVGSTRRGAIGRVLLGSTAESLLHGASCAVAVAPRGLHGHVTDRLYVIGVGYDGSPESERALEAANVLARGAGATLRVVTAVEPPATGAVGLSYGYGEAVLGAMEEQARQRLDAAIERVSPEVRALGIKRRGEPATILAAEARKGFDLIVIGSRGYGPFRRALLGSVSARLLQIAPCPVLVMPRGAAQASSIDHQPQAVEAATNS